MGPVPPLRPRLALRGRGPERPRGLLRGGRIAAPLLALHGFTGSGADFAPLEASLSPLLAPDLPGHGLSPKAVTAPACAMQGAVHSALAALDEAGIRRTVVLGYSMGGRVALHLAAAHPERVAALILIGATPGLRSEAERTARRAADEALAERIEQDGTKRFLAYWEQVPIIATQRRIPTAIRASMRSRRLASSAAGWAASLRGMGTGAMEPVWAGLEGISAPVLLVTGQDDRKFGEIAEEMRAELPDARHVRVKEAGHCAHLEALGETARVLQEFLSTVSGSPEG